MDLVDLTCQHYNIAKHPKLRAMLGVDIMEPREIFKFMKGLIFPIVEDEYGNKTVQFSDPAYSKTNSLITPDFAI